MLVPFAEPVSLSIAASAELKLRSQTKIGDRAGSEKYLMQNESVTRIVVLSGHSRLAFRFYPAELGGDHVAIVQDIAGFES
jgi:hypothetical protein